MCTRVFIFLEGCMKKYFTKTETVLVVLWTMASISDMRYASVTACLLAFLANDVYGFISWQKMKRRQSAT